MIMLKMKLTAQYLLPGPVAITGLLTFLCLSAFAQPPKLNSNTSASATVYLDFDGQVVKGTAWNWDGTINAKPAGLTNAAITEIFKRISEDFRIFNLNITTDPTVYTKAPLSRRTRIIFTPTYQWYGPAGGVAFVNSFSWGDDTPAWVFVNLLDYNRKYVAEAGSHEIGHTLGLQHQSTYNSYCKLVTEYAEGRGTGEIGWAPIMGTGYYKNLTTWTYGSTIEGCKVIQNDISIISKGSNNIGLRRDEHGNSRFSATSLLISSNTFKSTGIINHAADKDFFKVVLTKQSRLKIAVTPFNVAAGNSGANADLFMSLVKSTGDTIVRANPRTLLGASLDTLLPAGTYYIGIDGVKNIYVSDYGSAGFYNLTGTIQSTVSSTVMIRGDIKYNTHLLNWTSYNLTSTNRTYLEYSVDGSHFLPMSSVPSNATDYAYKPVNNGNIYYRVKMLLPDETEEYSNVIQLNSYMVSLVNSMVTNTVQLNSPGDYAYQLIDETGRMLQKGRIVRGLNTVHLSSAKRGLLIMKVFGNNQQVCFKLMKQ